MNSIEYAAMKEKVQDFETLNDYRKELKKDIKSINDIGDDVECLCSFTVKSNGFNSICLDGPARELKAAIISILNERLVETVSKIDSL